MENKDVYLITSKIRLTKSGIRQYLLNLGFKEETKYYFWYKKENSIYNIYNSITPNIPSVNWQFIDLQEQKEYEIPKDFDWLNYDSVETLIGALKNE